MLWAFATQARSCYANGSHHSDSRNPLAAITSKSAAWLRSRSSEAVAYIAQWSKRSAARRAAIDSRRS